MKNSILLLEVLFMFSLLHCSKHTYPGISHRFVYRWLSYVNRAKLHLNWLIFLWLFFRKKIQKLKTILSHFFVEKEMTTKEKLLLFVVVRHIWYTPRNRTVGLYHRNFASRPQHNAILDRFKNTFFQRIQNPRKKWFIIINYEKLGSKNLRSRIKSKTHRSFR